MKDTLEFLLGLSKTIIQGLSETKKFESEAIGDGIADGIDKSRKQLFTIGISVALTGTGFFIVMWGIATAIDTFFTMKGIGYVLIGAVAALMGALVFRGK